MAAKRAGRRAPQAKRPERGEGPRDEMDETFLTTEEVLEYLQVNLRTVYRLIKAGKIPAVRVGRQWRFRKRDIDAWLDSQRPRGERTFGVASFGLTGVSSARSSRPPAHSRRR